MQSVAEKRDEALTDRRRLPAWKLVAQAAGSPREVLGKAKRFAHIVFAYTDGKELHARMARLQARGHMESAPTGWQLLAGSVDMVRFWISPASSDYYARIGIGFGLHQLLRFLDEPASLTDPVGFFSSRDGIIGHLMQVVHANPVYDLQLLDMFDDGLDELERQVEQMLAGTHPRAQAIGAIVEEPDYHQRLLDFMRAWRKDPSVRPLLRQNIEVSRFRDIEPTFGSLTTAMRYFARMPSTATGAIKHIVTVKQFPVQLGEPPPVRAAAN